MNLDDVRRAIDLDEIDYRALKNRLGPDAAPLLRQLVAEDEPRIASKAAYLAAMYQEEGVAAVELAAISRHEIVRSAAAAALPLLPIDSAEPLAETLLTDPDATVRARAIKSTTRVGSPRARELLEQIAENDDEATLRDLARDGAEDMPE